MTWTWSATAACRACSAACTRPSTLGEFLRAFTHGHVRQLQGVSREFLVQLARRTRLLPGAGAVTFIDVDSLLRRVYGKQKQGAAFGHAKVGGYQVLLRGLNPLVATISTPDAAPVIAATQLRAGNAGSARGAAALLAEAIATTRAVLAMDPRAATGEIVVRADSAFYSRKVIAACRRAAGAVLGHRTHGRQDPQGDRRDPG